MTIRLKTLASVLLVFAMLSAKSQLSFTNCILTPGDVYTVTNSPSIISPSIVPGAAGTGKFWDFTNCAGTNQLSDTVFSPNQSALSLFPNSTLMRKNGYYFSCYKMGASGLEFLGRNTTLKYSDPELITPNPLTYGSSYTDTWTYTVNLGNNVINTGKATVNMLADAWGVIFTPGGNFYNTIRLKSVNTITVSSNTQPDKIYNHIDYYWYQEGFHLPVFSLLTWTLSGSFQQTASYLDFGANYTALQEQMKFTEQAVFPNPTRESIKLNGFENGANVYVHDLLGKLVLQAKYGENATLNLAGLNAGLYLLNVQESSGTVKNFKIEKID